MAGGAALAVVDAARRAVREGMAQGGQPGDPCADLDISLAGSGSADRSDRGATRGWLPTLRATARSRTRRMAQGA
jgi:hypothetical protein